ncbi:MAG TPA: EamA family transporter, partial [Ktedonosporobacter sp.]|nr:EamA family transporter [Ktedonosporobacter sp.]
DRINLIIPVGLSAAAIIMGVLTGACAAIGYFALYHSLEIGPIAITSPLSSTSAVVTLVLSTLLLRERVTVFSGIALAVVLAGVILASTDRSTFFALFKISRKSLMSDGARWAYLASLSFGLVDFGIGASAPANGWFVPVFLTFNFSTLFLALISIWRAQRVEAIAGSIVTLLKNPIASLFAVLAGMLECAGIIMFGVATQTVKPGMTAAIASNYSLIALLFGILVFRERLTRNQWFGIGLVVSGLTILIFLSREGQFLLL